MIVVWQGLGYLSDIKQWGTVDISSAKDEITVTFPISFGSECFYFKTTNINSQKSYSVDYEFQVATLTITKVNLYKQNFNDTTVIYKEKIKWFAIGK